MKNYYELFRYSLANGESYSDINLSSLKSRYDLISLDIDTRKKLVHVGTPDYATLVEMQNQLDEAYAVLSDATKRAEYDASLAKAKPVKTGATTAKKVVCALVTTVLLSTASLGGCEAKHGDDPAPAEIVSETTTPSAEDYDALLREATGAEVVETAPVDTRVRFGVENLGDVEDDALVMERATKLVEELDAANVLNPVTSARWTVEQVYALIKYANGVYAPSSIEEIDILHLNLLNLLISQLNTDDYLYHVLFASGNDDFNALLNPKPNHVGFSEAFAAYGENGVYPLVKWFEAKRFAIYSSTNREEVNALYREVGQVMADLMKGNGCTITWEGVTYTFTSEEVLANHSSAMLITIEFQLIMANHYEIRNAKEEIIDEVPQTWEVYNKFNSSGVDENGMPIIRPDIVSYEEMNAWVNNGCDYEWPMESVLIDGQTFGQRIQSDMEGMALNNYHMYSVSK